MDLASLLSIPRIAASSATSEPLGTTDPILRYLVYFVNVFWTTFALGSLTTNNSTVFSGLVRHAREVLCGTSQSFTPSRLKSWLHTVIAMATRLVRHTGDRTRVKMASLGLLFTAMLGLTDVAAVTCTTAAVNEKKVWTITLFLYVLSILALVATVIRGLKLA